jgi:hypothetical protein
MTKKLKTNLVVSRYRGTVEGWKEAYQDKGYRSSTVNWVDVGLNEVQPYWDQYTSDDSGSKFTLYLGDLEWLLHVGPDEKEALLSNKREPVSKWAYREPTKKEVELYALHRVTWDKGENNE